MLNIQSVINSSSPRYHVREKNLSIPGPGRTLGGVVSKLNKPVLAVVNQLEDIFIDVLESDFEYLQFRRGPGSLNESINKRLAWFAVNLFITYVLINQKKSLVTFQEAFDWFFPKGFHGFSVCRCLGNRKISELERELESVFTEEFCNIYELLPYLIEPHGHITRNQHENCKKSGEIRRLKKNNGVFYTPGDVAEFIVSLALENDGECSSWLDPACGTGVLLKEVIRAQRLESASEGVFKNFKIVKPNR